MSDGFTKLFHSITTSTVWMQPDNVRIVWITMLALADKDGIVFASVPGLAHVARVELAATEAALKVLSEPDSYSRTPDADGRRVEAVDGGWRIINHAKYRNTRDFEDRREYERTRKLEQRSKTAGGAWVYFALDEGTGLVKIGFSTNPEVRVKTGSLKDAGAVGNVALLLKIPGSKELEAELHHRFGSYWSHLEWFRHEGELKEYISGTKNNVRDKDPVSAHTEAEAEAEEDQRQPGTAGPKPCPHQDIIDAYHELLPTLPRIRLWQGKRKSYLAARWREEPKRQDLNWWREFFKYVAKSDFLCGRVASTGERKDQPPFMADLEWLVREGNFVKIFEGKYHRRAA